MTYQVLQSGVWKTIVADAVAGGDGGFGYLSRTTLSRLHRRFERHNRRQDFYGRFALGLGFAVTHITTLPSNAAAHRLTLTPLWNAAPIPKNADGEDVSRTPASPRAVPALFAAGDNHLGFQNGKDFPRINIRVSLANLPGPDRVISTCVRPTACWTSTTAATIRFPR